MTNGKITVACELDKTLATFDRWRGPLHIGQPITAMIRCIQEHLGRGDSVMIFTSRLHDDPKTGVTIDMIRKEIGDWTEKHVGARLAATNIKLPIFDLFYDNRAIQVVPNTGKRVLLKKEVLRSK